MPKMVVVEKTGNVIFLAWFTIRPFSAVVDIRTYDSFRYVVTHVSHEQCQTRQKAGHLNWKAGRRSKNVISHPKTVMLTPMNTVWDIYSVADLPYCSESPKPSPWGPRRGLAHSPRDHSSASPHPTVHLSVDYKGNMTDMSKTWRHLPECFVNRIYSPNNILQAHVLCVKIIPIKQYNY